MTSSDPASSSAAWQSDLMDLLAQIDAATTPDAEARVLTHLASMDSAFQRFLVANVADQASTESATFLAALAAHPGTPPDVRAEARAALAALAEQNIHPVATGEEEFYTGWVQHGRETGEQIMILGWRMPDGRIDACVFLLAWRGDGLKDFYRTRELSAEEWSALVQHNGKKGAPLTEISLAEGRALLDLAIAEGKRFSRPTPREYRLASGLLQARVFDATAPAELTRSFVAPDLGPRATVQAYVAGLHYRDYLLMYELLAHEHPVRAAGSTADAVETLRREHKHAPRRREDVRTSSKPLSDDAQHAIVQAEGDEEVVEPSGRRTRHPVRERYTLARTPAGWRIARVERL
jgi:hypothetical protein